MNVKKYLHIIHFPLSLSAENVYVRIKDTFIVHMELETLSFCLYSDSWLINLVILILPVYR